MVSMRLKLSRRGLIALITLLLAGFAGLLWQLAPQSYALWFSYGGLTLALLLLLGRYLRQLDHEVLALNLQADSLRDQSFNLAANSEILGELKPLANALNDMSAELMRQRATLYQRELLLDTVLQTSPVH